MITQYDTRGIINSQWSPNGMFLAVQAIQQRNEEDYEKTNIIIYNKQMNFDPISRIDNIETMPLDKNPWWSPNGDVIAINIWKTVEGKDEEIVSSKEFDYIGIF